MKTATLPHLSAEQLTDKFVEIGMRQKIAVEDDNIRTYNKLYTEMIKIVDELKFRIGDQRRALIPLYSHDNIQVRLLAAKLTFALAPGEARRTLEAISASNWYPYAAEARSMLFAVDEGLHRPE